MRHKPRFELKAARECLLLALEELHRARQHLEEGKRHEDADRLSTLTKRVEAFHAELKGEDFH